MAEGPVNKTSWRDVTEADLAAMGKLKGRGVTPAENAIGLAKLTQAAKTPRFDYADTLKAQIALCGLPEPLRDYRFDAKEHGGGSGRRWLMDLAWPDLMVSCEVDGGEWSGGKHSRGLGMQSNCEKLNAALLAGWKPYRFTGSQVTSGYALKTMEKALGGRT